MSTRLTLMNPVVLTEAFEVYGVILLIAHLCGGRVPRAWRFVCE